MWICPQCNEAVPDPAKRRCPKGHSLFDWRIFRSTKEQSVLGAFFDALLASIVIVVAVTALGRLVPQPAATALTAVALIALVIAGIVGLRRAREWQQQGGAVARLAPRARGMGLGCIVTAAGLFVVGIVVDMMRSR